MNPDAAAHGPANLQALTLKPILYVANATLLENLILFPLIPRIFDPQGPPVSGNGALQALVR